MLLFLSRIYDKEAPFITCKSLSGEVHKAIELYFDKLDEVIADKRIDNLKAGKTTLVPLEEVFKKAGINA